MNGAKNHILAQLEKEILPLQGLRSCVHSNKVDVGLGAMHSAFPNGQFPLAAVHEFCCNSIEDVTASGGFVSGILSSLMHGSGATLWLSRTTSVFPHGLTQFCIAPHHVLFITAKKEKEILWVIEEALQCNTLSAVVGELPELSFTASRRLQLLVEESGVPLFLLRHKPKNLSTSCVSRWRIQPIGSEIQDDLPGMGLPRWKVELLKIRNGKPGSWIVEWDTNHFRVVYPQTAVVTALQRKTG